MSSAPKHAPTWKFGVTGIAYGIAGGFQGTLMPYLLRRAGISVEEIGWFVTATFLPPVLQFLWAPMVDIGLRRRTWLVLVSILGSACFFAALALPLPAHKNEFLFLAVIGQLITGLIGACNGGLLATTLPNELRGAAGGWLNAGNLGGSALGASLTLFVADKMGATAAGLVLMLCTVVPALIALTIDEPPRPKRTLAEIFPPMLRDVVRTARSRAGWTGMLFCISPVGTAALMNFFAALAEDYKASPRMVESVNGWVSAIVTAAGALIGGWICDRVDRRLMYLLSGGLTAVCGLVMAAAPITPMTYALGVSIYLFVAGFCYAAFSAVVLEIVGKAGDSASAQYSLFVAAGNFAIMYTGWIDTRFHKAHGPRGLLYSDALLNAAGVVALALVIRFVLKKLRAPAAPASA